MSLIEKTEKDRYADLESAMNERRRAMDRHAEKLRDAAAARKRLDECEGLAEGARQDVTAATIKVAAAIDSLKATP